jgi:hypothetical protein
MAQTNLPAYDRLFYEIFCPGPSIRYVQRYNSSIASVIHVLYTSCLDTDMLDYLSVQRPAFTGAVMRHEEL